MGNVAGGMITRNKKTKVMRIDGQIIKLKTPIRASDVVKDYPGHVLLDSDSVKRSGVRAKPLEPQQELNPRKVYFLVDLPKFPIQPEMAPRRARSAMHVSAKDRLELLMLSRRSASDLSVARPTSSRVPDGVRSDGGPVQVKLRLPKAQVAKLVEESRDGAEVAEKIVDLYIQNGDVTAPHLQRGTTGGVLKQHVMQKRVNFRDFGMATSS